MVCPCCHKEVDSFHKRSHVLPDWMFRETYTENHQLIEIDLRSSKTSIKQTAPNGKYWCNECEKRSSSLDKYASELLTERPPGSAVRRSLQKRSLYSSNQKGGAYVEHWSGFDFRPLQNFIFSVIIRAELYSRGFGQRLIPPSHFLKMCQAFNDICELDSSVYPFFVVRSPSGEMFEHISVAPHKVRYENHNVIAFRGAGFTFHVFVSSHAKSFESQLAIARESGELFCIVDEFQNSTMFRSSYLNLLTAIGKRPDPLRTRSRKDRIP